MTYRPICTNGAVGQLAELPCLKKVVLFSGYICLILSPVAGHCLELIVRRQQRRRVCVWVDDQSTTGGGVDRMKDTHTSLYHQSLSPIF